MSKTEQSRQLRDDIAEFLVDLSVLGGPQGRETFLNSARLDPSLRRRINRDGSPEVFCKHLYDEADNYGNWDDGDTQVDAVIAILEQAKTHVGSERKKNVDELIQRRLKIIKENISLMKVSPNILNARSVTMTSSKQGPSILPGGILIVTVTKVETRAILKTFTNSPNATKNRFQIKKKVYYFLGTHGNAQVFMVQSEMGIATPGGALITVQRAIQDLEPQAIILCGIAFGLHKDKQNIGDILISKQLEYYEPLKIDHQTGKIPRGDRVAASEGLIDKFRSGDNDWLGARTHFGLFLTGEKLVNDQGFRDWLARFEPEAIGGDMEGAGLYTAARDAKVDWIIVKAICDWADGSKNDDAQPVAADNAAQFVFHVLTQIILTPSEIAETDIIDSGLESPQNGPNGTDGHQYHEPYIPFANREQEINRIVNYPDEGSYYLIEGPAGYGKSRLLLEIEKRFAEKDSNRCNWLCIYISLLKHASFKEIVELIINSLGLEIHPNNLERPYLTGFMVGKAIAQKRDELESNGFCLLLDVDTDTDKELELLITIVKDIADNFVKGIFDGLTEKADSFFAHKEKRFKFIIAGRYLTNYVYPQLENKRFKIIHLRPFEYEIVREICSKLAFEKIANCNDFAAQILYYSGGHPGCMAKILARVGKYHPNNPTDFLDEHWAIMDAIAGQQASTVRASIEQSLRETFDVLCVYPRFDYGILERLIAAEELDVSVNEDAYDLAMKLKRTFLVDWADDNRLHLSDSITRRLLIVHLRHNHPREFQRRCKKAYENCTIRMREQVELRFQWGVESLTAFLQIRTNQIQNMSVRRELKEEFFKNILPDILSKLVEGRDRRVEKEPFLRAVEKHPDLRFMVNFYLREGVYDDSPYREFLQIVGQFFN